MIISSSGLSKILNNKMKRTQTNLEKTIEKLATGQRIRSAANDASGLAISQKMLALSRGGHQAIRNVQDATSMVQIADGAMQEMIDILHRIRELTVQSMNGTYSELEEQSGSLSSADTLIIQNEIDDLKMNLNDIVKSTEFNDIKLLSNSIPGEYVYENRTAQKEIHLGTASQEHPLDIEANNVGFERMYPVVQSFSKNYTYNSTTFSAPIEPKTYIASTIVDHLPRWSEDGISIVFTSNRNQGEMEYVVPVDGSTNTEVNSNVSTAPQITESSNGLMRLRNSGSTLILERRTSTIDNWSTLQTYENYKSNDGNIGYSFSPKVGTDGVTSFVYSDNAGNINKVDVNIVNRTVLSNPVNIIPSTDTIDLPSGSNNIALPSSPSLYLMNTENASLCIQKINDNGARELTYWDGLEPPNPPLAGGYYTISGSTVTFFGDAIIKCWCQAPLE